MITNLHDEIIKTLENNIMFKYANIEDTIIINREQHRLEVIEEIKHYIGESKVSELMLFQLTDLHGKNYIEIDGKKHPYNIGEIYLKMKDIITGNEKQKKFHNKKSKLYGKGIYHVHHSQSFYIEDNHIRYFKIKYPNSETIIGRLQELTKQYPDKEPIPILIYETLIESISWDKKTGEWILFQRKNQNYYFIGLAIHNYGDEDDSALYEKIREYIL
jgi:hypothetical protein